MEENLEYDRFIAYHRNQINPVPHQKSTLTFAYGDQRYQKMTLELATPDDILRTKVLKEINEDFHHAHKLNFALVSSDILSELVRAFADKDDVIRELASRAVIQVNKTE